MYYPWYDEDVDLEGGYATYEKYVQSLLQTREQIYCHDEVDNVNLYVIECSTRVSTSSRYRGSKSLAISRR